MTEPLRWSDFADRAAAGWLAFALAGIGVGAYAGGRAIAVGRPLLAGVAFGCIALYTVHLRMAEDRARGVETRIERLVPEVLRW